MRHTFYLDEATGEMLKTLSDELHISKSALLRMLIAEKCNNKFQLEKSN